LYLKARRRAIVYQRVTDEQYKARREREQQAAEEDVCTPF
jgi:hypothetical protein